MNQIVGRKSFLILIFVLVISANMSTPSSIFARMDYTNDTGLEGDPGDGLDVYSGGSSSWVNPTELVRVSPVTDSRPYVLSDQAWRPTFIKIFPLNIDGKIIYVIGLETPNRLGGLK